MNDYTVKRLGFILSIQAEIEGMKAENNKRDFFGEGQAYTDKHFQQKADELKDYALRADHQLI